MDYVSLITGAILLAIILVSVLRAGVWMNTGLTDEAFTLSSYVATEAMAEWVVALYSNNHTPTTGDVIGAYTECLFSGYARVTPGTWNAGSVSGNSIPIVAPVAIFTQTASPVNDTCYGYYILDGAGNLVAAELLAGGPFAFNAIGKSLQITITETLTRV